jgi:hypothetical protein
MQTKPIEIKYLRIMGSRKTYEKKYYDNVKGKMHEIKILDKVKGS